MRRDANRKFTLTAADGDFYWLNAPAIDTQEPLMIGRFSAPDGWFIDGRLYKDGPGIECLEHISWPKRRV